MLWGNLPMHCYRSCLRTDPMSCGVGYGCDNAGLATSVCLRVGTIAAGEVCPDNAPGFATSTRCKDTGFRCAGAPERRCRQACDPAAAEPGCPAGQVCTIDTCLPPAP